MSTSVAKLIKVSEALGGARILCDRDNELLNEEFHAIEKACGEQRLQDSEEATKWALDGIGEACQTRFVPYRMQYQQETRGTNWLFRVVARPPMRMTEGSDVDEFRRNYVLPDHWKNAASVATEILAIRSMVAAKSICLRSVGVIPHPNPNFLGLNLVAIMVCMDSDFSVPVNLKLQRMQPYDLHGAVLAFARKILRRDLPQPKPDPIPERPHGASTAAPLVDEVDPKNYLRLLQKQNKTAQEKLYLEKKKLVDEQADQFMASHVSEDPKERRIRGNVTKWFPDPYQYDTLVDAESAASSTVFNPPPPSVFRSLGDDLNPAVNPPLAKRARGEAPSRRYAYDSDSDDDMADEEVQRRREHADFLQRMGGVTSFGFSTAMPIGGGQARRRVDVSAYADDEGDDDIMMECSGEGEEDNMYADTFGITEI